MEEILFNEEGLIEVLVMKDGRVVIANRELKANDPVYEEVEMAGYISHREIWDAALDFGYLLADVGKVVVICITRRDGTCGLNDLGATTLLPQGRNWPLVGEFALQLYDPGEPARATHICKYCGRNELRFYLVEVLPDLGEISSFY